MLLLGLLWAGDCLAASVDDVKRDAAACAAAAGGDPYAYLDQCRRARQAYDAYVNETYRLSSDPRVIATSLQIVAAASQEIDSNLRRATALAAARRRRDAEAAQAAAAAREAAKQQAAEQAAAAAAAVAAEEKARRERMQAAAAAKGPAFAASAGVTFSVISRNNEMTDKVDHILLSSQDDGTDVLAEIEGRCTQSGDLNLTLLVTDKSGRPTINVIGLNVLGFLDVEFRRDDEEITDASLPVDDFKNKFRLIEIRPDDLKIHWRYLYKIKTDHGSIVVKIPLWNVDIQQMMGLCSSSRS